MGVLGVRCYFQFRCKRMQAQRLQSATDHRPEAGTRSIRANPRGMRKSIRSGAAADSYRLKMTVSDANDPRAKLTPGLYDAGGGG